MDLVQLLHLETTHPVDLLDTKWAEEHVLREDDHEYASIANTFTHLCLGDPCRLHVDPSGAASLLYHPRECSHDICRFFLKMAECGKMWSSAKSMKVLIGTTCNTHKVLT
jgi:hypothetical protein